MSGFERTAKRKAKLIEQWRYECTLRDMGVTADKTWKRIVKITTPKERLKLLGAS